MFALSKLKSPDNRTHLLIVGLGKKERFMPFARALSRSETDLSKILTRLIIHIFQQTIHHEPLFIVINTVKQNETLD